MKPRTKEQKILTEFASILPPLTKTQKEWAEKQFVNEYGYFSAPNFIYTLFITTYNGYTVLRVFYTGDLSYTEPNGNTHERVGITECYQIWTSDKGKSTIVSRSFTRSPFRSCYWKFNSDWGIAKHNEICTGSYYYDDMFSTSGLYTYPRIKATPLLKRNGFTADVVFGVGRRTDIDLIMRKLLTDPFIEELAKTGQYALCSNALSSDREYVTILDWQHAIRICTRNRYIVKDVSVWLDYLDLLHYYNKDTHNAHYVCPENLRTAHDRLVAKKRREDEEEARKRAINEARKEEEKYKTFRSHYFDVAFNEEGIHIHVISSTQEMAEEGNEMHHCVFTNRYFDRARHPHSIILSARNDQGERLETIEVSESSWKVHQCRAKYNGETPQHKQILDIMRRNMYRLKERYTAHTQTKKTCTRKTA